jgi:hypothetical protein
VESKLGPLGTAAIYCPIVLAPGDCEDGELFGGMKIGRGNRSTRRKPAPAPICPPQIPLDQTRDRNRAAAVGSQRLTASAMARPVSYSLNTSIDFLLHVSIYDLGHHGYGSILGHLTLITWVIDHRRYLMMT